MKHIKAFNEGFKAVKQPQVYLIDKNTKEYLGTFRSESDAISAQQDSITPDDERIVIASSDDFEVKSDGKKYYTGN